MIAAALIVFREALEAALVITLVLAATRGVASRNRWISAGVLAGIAGAGLVAFSAETIANALDGIGQEVMNACVLFAAVVMLIWHNVWMAQHGRELSQRLKQVGKQVQSGDEPLYALALAVGLAVLREGSEVVLFLHGIAASGTTTHSLITGSLMGLSGGIAVGALLYLGLLRIPIQHFFAVTFWMILLLAAGMAANAVGFLDQAGLINYWNAELWDTSSWLPEHDHLAGELLHILVGYQASPTGMQLFSYMATLIITLSLAQWVTRRNQWKPSKQN